MRLWIITRLPGVVKIIITRRDAGSPDERLERWLAEDAAAPG